MKANTVVGSARRDMGHMNRGVRVMGHGSDLATASNLIRMECMRYPIKLTLQLFVECGLAGYKGMP